MVEKVGQWVVTVFSNPEVCQVWMAQQEEYLLSDQAQEVIGAVQVVQCGGTKHQQQSQLLTYLNNT